MDRELTIKYSEHYKDLFYLRHLTDYNNKVPPVFKQKLEKYDSRYNEDSQLNRNWFQDYAHALNLEDSTFEKPSVPNLLQNTVAEEIAKNKILRYYQSNNWISSESDENQKVKAIINRILKTGDSLSIRIIPFSYDVTNTYKNCQTDNKTVLVPSNPFYYHGSLSHLSCEVRNQKTNEVVRVKFH